MAASTVSVRISKEPELKGLKITCNSHKLKMRKNCNKTKKMRKFYVKNCVLFAVHFMRIFSTSHTLIEL